MHESPLGVGVHCGDAELNATGENGVLPTCPETDCVAADSPTTPGTGEPATIGGRTTMTCPVPAEIRLTSEGDGEKIVFAETFGNDEG